MNTDPLLATGGPHSPYANHDDTLSVAEREAIVDFEARTGGKIAAKLAQPVIEYYKALATWYEMQYKMELAKQQGEQSCLSM